MIEASKRGIGPKCYFANNKFRIEEFLTGFNHPNNEHLKDHGLIKSIMNKAAEFHQIEMEDIKHLKPFADFILSEEFVNKAKGII